MLQMFWQGMAARAAPVFVLPVLVCRSSMCEELTTTTQLGLSRLSRNRNGHPTA